MFVAEKGAAFSEARRVLRQRGAFIFTVWDSLEHNPQARAVDETFRQLFPEIPRRIARLPTRSTIGRC
jgi:ubiquinone/menaquinone biosynthesis C-methylase UbiE